MNNSFDSRDSSRVASEVHSDQQQQQQQQQQQEQDLNQSFDNQRQTDEKLRQYGHSEPLRTELFGDNALGQAFKEAGIGVQLDNQEIASIVNGSMNNILTQLYDYQSSFVEESKLNRIIRKYQECHDVGIVQLTEMILDNRQFSALVARDSGWAFLKQQISYQRILQPGYIHIFRELIYNIQTAGNKTKTELFQVLRTALPAQVRNCDHRAVQERYGADPAKFRYYRDSSKIEVSTKFEVSYEVLPYLNRASVIILGCFDNKTIRRFCCRYSTVKLRFDCVSTIHFDINNVLNNVRVCPGSSGQITHRFGKVDREVTHASEERLAGYLQFFAENRQCFKHDYDQSDQQVEGPTELSSSMFSANIAYPEMWPYSDQVIFNCHVCMNYRFTSQGRVNTCCSQNKLVCVQCIPKMLSMSSKCTCGSTWKTDNHQIDQSQIPLQRATQVLPDEIFALSEPNSVEKFIEHTQSYSEYAESMKPAPQHAQTGPSGHFFQPISVEPAAQQPSEQGFLKRPLFNGDEDVQQQLRWAIDSLLQILESQLVNAELKQELILMINSKRTGELDSTKNLQKRLADLLTNDDAVFAGFDVSQNNANTLQRTNVLPLTTAQGGESDGTVRQSTSMLPNEILDRANTVNKSGMYTDKAFKPQEIKPPSSDPNKEAKIGCPESTNQQPSLVDTSMQDDGVNMSENNNKDQDNNEHHNQSIHASDATDSDDSQTKVRQSLKPKMMSPARELFAKSDASGERNHSHHVSSDLSPSAQTERSDAPPRINSDHASVLKTSIACENYDGSREFGDAENQRPSGGLGISNKEITSSKGLPEQQRSIDHVMFKDASQNSDSPEQLEQSEQDDSGTALV